MLCRRLRILAGAIVLGAFGCVEVPDTIRAQFAGPGPNDPSHYRPGNYPAPPPAPVSKATTLTAADAADTSAADASTAASDGDGGAP